MVEVAAHPSGCDGTLVPVPLDDEIIATALASVADGVTDLLALRRQLGLEADR